MIKREDLDTTDFSDVSDGETLKPVTPGEVLASFLEDYEITPYRLAKDTGMAPTRPGEIINKGRAITADTALRLGKYFGNKPAFWMSLQSQYDTESVIIIIGDELENIKTIAS